LYNKIEIKKRINQEPILLKLFRVNYLFFSVYLTIPLLQVISKVRLNGLVKRVSKFIPNVLHRIGSRSLSLRKIWSKCTHSFCNISNLDALLYNGLTYKKRKLNLLQNFILDWFQKTNHRQKFGVHLLTLFARYPNLMLCVTIAQSYVMV